MLTVYKDTKMCFLSQFLIIKTQEKYEILQISSSKKTLAKPSI